MSVLWKLTFRILCLPEPTGQTHGTRDAGRWPSDRSVSNPLSLAELLCQRVNPRGKCVASGPPGKRVPYAECQPRRPWQQPGGQEVSSS